MPDYGAIAPTNFPLRAINNDSLTSFNNRYKLIMQSDGNLVLYDVPGTAVLWASDTLGQGDNAVMQSDGNFVLYDASGGVLFSSDTAPRPDYAAFLWLQDDGNLVIYEYVKESLWATETAQ